jgi:hypothetical protein
MIWLGYFMAGIMWHLNKQIYHCNTVVWILFYIRALRKDLGYNYTVIYDMILLQCLIYHISSTIGIIFSSMLFPIKTISQTYEHCTEW